MFCCPYKKRILFVNDNVLIFLKIKTETSRKMSIVNCKVQNIRPKYNNLKEWMEDNNNIYIARSGVVFIDKKRFPKKSSNFSNPYKIGKDGTREEVISKYKIYILEKIKNDEALQIEFNELRGKNLGCWCFPEMCHGNVLLDLLNS